MADYKELLRRAVEALPENNGAARRAVYEKARAALVGQLRAIHPPLPARDITTHRLQLEDCIRQVEQESSEAVIAGMGSQSNELPPPPVYFENGANKANGAAKPHSSKPGASRPMLVASSKEPAKAPLPAGGTIEDIIAAANAETPVDAPAPARKRGSKAVGESKNAKAPVRLASPPVQANDDDGEPDILPPRPAAKPARPLPAIVARAEAAKNRSASTAFSVPAGDKPYDAPRRGPSIEPRQGMMPAAARGGQAAIARQPVAGPVAFSQDSSVVAMSAVREVEVEPPQADPQGAIDRAIATLDREARGDHPPMINGAANDVEDEIANGKAKNGFASMIPGRKQQANGRVPQRQAALPPPAQARDTRTPLAFASAGRRTRESAFSEPAFPRARPERERGGLGAVSIFLIVFAVLLIGAGGAGYWAMTQGYLDISGLFGKPATATAAAPDAAATVTAEATVPATGPGNTAGAAAETVPAAELATTDERLTPDPALTGDGPLAMAAAPQASEERLTSDAAQPQDPATAEAAVASLDPANIAGSQSLLLEASDDGKTGAVPFSGTVDWSKGKDEMGQPTLVGKASIPARNLAVDVLIRKNSDPSLPASHLMEINFKVSDSFIGGSVAGLPGVLLKNEELVQGTPLVGASARVVGNQFLFALSASPDDISNNAKLLTGQKWIDLALIYATGKRAIITLEKDPAAEGLFNEVFVAWGQAASN